MAATESLVAAGVLLALGLLVGSQARRAHDRYRTITEIIAAPEGSGDPGSEAIVRGPVTVSDPATAEREPPAEVVETVDSPAVWAWRVRRKVGGGSDDVGNANWQTVEGGLAVGAFTVRQDWDRVRVDGEWLRTQLGAGDAVTDPFDRPNLYLGSPDVDVPLGERNPLNRLLERLGVTGEEGAFTNWEMSLTVGRRTTSPDRYQATVVDDGDELVVRGVLAETDDGLVLRGTEDTPLVLATGDLERTRKRLRTSALWQGAASLALVLLAAAVVVVAFL
ncbi:hypothetical protein SAMN05216559_0376 [Halomicrobium zhouii]|uniref:Uncharacterized protein n=1 Tax=Halomicrobium zhouii TaxID=767519 RepID=A0A1I6K9L2_9EURY|nr:hypothetical protein [Halomicrobium zhouii]SFR87570.1 hypothetical protein SAMN05216559_0376 [Halomicrobium zhouii]